MDRVINGELGAGREWYEQLLPVPVARILSGTVSEDPGSKFGQAFMQTVAQLEAAGVLDNLTTRDVNGVAVEDPAKLQEFYDTLQAQIKNNMVAYTLFGMWAPAAPGLPTNVVESDAWEMPRREDFDSEEAWLSAVKAAERQGAADWSWHEQGLASLKDQARMIFSELGYEAGMEWWIKNHPGELIWAPGYTSTSKVTGDTDATAPPTLAGIVWIEDNAEFLRRYHGVASYFMPQGTPGTDSGEFSQVAYDAQLEQGLRERKDLREFLTDVIVKRGERIYYDTKDDYNEAIARAEAAGDTATVETLEAEWQQHKQLLYLSNPLLQAKNVTYAENETNRQQQLAQLLRIMDDPISLRAIGDGQAQGVQQLLDAYREYETARADVKGKRGSAATSRRVQLKEAYEAEIARIVDTFPGLADLARGLFRVPA
jgi:hypothetical protein